jgi:hypothetical protein
VLYEVAKQEGVTVLGLTEVAALLVDSGLTQWLIQKASWWSLSLFPMGLMDWAKR